MEGETTAATQMRNLRTATTSPPAELESPEEDPGGTRASAAPDQGPRHRGSNGNGNGGPNGRAIFGGASQASSVISITRNRAESATVGRAAPARPTPGGDDPTDGFVITERAREFRARCFPEAGDAEWNNWQWQLRNRIMDLPSLARVFELSLEEVEAMERLGDRLPVGVTPYYASLIDPKNPNDPIRRTMNPLLGEFLRTPGEAEDPLNEDGHMVTPGLVHRYPDRVLFLVSSFCAVYCRYCTRSRLVGKTGEYHFNTRQYEMALDYIRNHTEVRDVLISGGDPLTMKDDRIDWLLTRLREIPHVEFVRIGSKVPCVLPQRITPTLTKMLRKFHPFWLSIHFMHPNELTPESKMACERLADAGIPLGSQTVLLRGCNDDVQTMKTLMQGLLMMRVRPYYIYQCDPIPGSSHFRVPVSRAMEIMEGLRGHTTGYAVPTFVIDAPGGGGKIPVVPNYVVGRDGDDLLLRNYEGGKVYRYPDPQGASQA
jgi:lysine 2,3-aminomutase